MQRIGTQESNIFNNVTIENELEWRLNDNNIYTVRSRHTHTKANTVINHYGEKYTSKERHLEIVIDGQVQKYLIQIFEPIFIFFVIVMRVMHSIGLAIHEPFRSLFSRPISYFRDGRLRSRFLE